MRRTMRYLSVMLPAALLWLPAGMLHAQRDTIRKEVRVVKPYEPSLSGARKISITPVAGDTVKYHPEITYSISPKPMMAPYVPRPIKPARLQAESVPKLYKSYLKLGFGNHITPLLEFNMSSLRSKDHVVGMYVRSLSSYGDVKLNNGKKVDGNYGSLKGELYGKKIFRYATIDGSVYFRNDKNLYYGYAPQLDTSLVKDSIRQNYMNPGALLGIHSTHADSNHVNYSAALRYDYFQDKYDHAQHGLDFTGSLFKVFSGKTIGFRTDVLYFNSDLYPAGTHDANITVEPWFYQSTSEWRLKASIAATFDLTEGNTDIRLYPRIRFQFRIIPGYLQTYLGMDGRMEVNDYMTMTRINPFLKPGLYVGNTDRKMEFFLGLSGSLAPGTEYKVKGSFSLIDQMPFFINDTADVAGNRFIVAYDDVQLFRLSGEFTGRISEKFSLFLKGAYNNYSMSVLQKPWHKPPFEGSLGVKYSLQDKIVFRGDFSYTGKRYATTPDMQVVRLDGYPDLNLGFEYRYRKILSFFLDFSNIFSVRYEPWHQFPTQGFFIMGGFTYSL